MVNGRLSAPLKPWRRPRPRTNGWRVPVNYIPIYIFISRILFASSRWQPHWFLFKKWLYYVGVFEVDIIKSDKILRFAFFYRYKSFFSRAINKNVLLCFLFCLKQNNFIKSLSNNFQHSLPSSTLHIRFNLWSPFLLQFHHLFYI